MKKIAAVLITVALCAVQAQAQSYFDNAVSLSDNNYLGTARTIGMGNAVTAVGGDPGSFTINPAGSAVAGYSQFVVTPGLNISVSPASYAPISSGPFTTSNKEGKVRFALHNIGFSLRFEPNDNSIVRSLHFSFVANGTNTYTNSFRTTGINSTTSKFAEFAATAAGIPSWELGASDAYSDNNLNSLWDVVTAYRAGLINSYSGDRYAATSEFLMGDLSYRYIPGALNQTNSVSSVGSKTDILFNFGSNFGDFLYAGINLGIPTASISSTTTYREAPLDPEQFPVLFDASKGVTHYNSGSYQYNYVSRVDGVYAKLGFIVLPTSFLRIGAAIKTPTAFTISESWRHNASSSFSDSYWNLSATSLNGTSRYAMRSSYEVNTGVALTFGSVGMLSVDYEMTDFSVMKYKEIGSNFESDAMYSVNLVNKLFGGVSHSLRAGAEFRIIDMFAIRAGYNLTTCPERHYSDQYGNDVTAANFEPEDYTSGKLILSDRKYFDANRWSVSAGFGYDPMGRFYVDLAAKMTAYPVSNFYPYYDYANVDKNGIPVNVPSPRISVWRKLWNVALTFGWRF